MSTKRVFTQIIKNEYLPVCNKCIYFSQYKNTANMKKYIEMSKCTKFGDKDIITGNIEYMTACNARKNKDYCGIYGIYFEPNNYDVL